MKEKVVVFDYSVVMKSLKDNYHRFHRLIEKVKERAFILLYGSYSYKHLGNQLLSKGIDELFDRIYSKENMREFSGKRIKDLGAVCREFNVKYRDVLMVGDSAIDMLSARNAYVNYLRVSSPEKLERILEWLNN